MAANRPSAYAVTRHVVVTRDFHALLRDKFGQQIIERAHQVGRTLYFERPLAFNQGRSVLANIAGHDAGKCTPQVGRQNMSRQILFDNEFAHRFVGRREWLLKGIVNREAPVEIVGITLLCPKLTNLIEPIAHGAGDVARNNARTRRYTTHSSGT